MPQLDSDAGIGLRLSQAPLAYSKKSTPGSTDRFMLAARKSPLAGSLVVPAGLWVQASASAATPERTDRVRRRGIGDGSFKIRGGTAPADPRRGRPGAPP